MKLNYYPETDSLYIDLSEQPSAESKEISQGVVLDYDDKGRLAGIDIDNASAKVELDKLGDLMAEGLEAHKDRAGIVGKRLQGLPCPFGAGGEAGAVV